MISLGRAITFGIAGFSGFVAALMLFAAAASAQGEILGAGQAVERDCALRPLAEATPGVALSSVDADATGLLAVELLGDSGSDWDLAVFEEGDVIAASTSFTSVEQATALVEDGDELVIQACRVAGSAERIGLRTGLYPLRAPARAPDPITLESVELDGAGDLSRLERLGFDVTHDVSAGSATVALYDDAERARLAARGYESTTLVPDLIQADAADRAAEDAAEAAAGDSTLPSTRESYRSYPDYTTELKALADANPKLVRSVEIGRTIENRPIEGVEIAVDVKRTDDGRPVYLNFGAHHAREWPSAELPMEFALDLVQRYNASDPRVVALLSDVRVIVVPVVNVDGFIVSRDAPGNGPNPAIDDDPDATLLLSILGQNAYNRKNCRPTVPGDTSPCQAREGQGVDLNRNYGAYWGGPGSSNIPATQNYRGTGPFSEPESEAVHDFTAGIHPTVFISNHTFTDGRWLRQPGFDAPFLPQTVVPTYDDDCPANDGSDLGAIVPDEAGMKSLGDAMATANGYISELGYETLCDITGATEDWNYFSQGTYGYTPEIRGVNFHANYNDMVVGEYPGMRDSYLIAGERAGMEAEHSVIEGTVPPGATLTLRKRFQTPTCEDAECSDGNGPSFTDTLETTLSGPADGTYEWHVNPSGRPLAPNETWTMRCEVRGGEVVRRDVAVARGQRVTENFENACAAPDGPPVDPPGKRGRCGGKRATIIGTAEVDRLVGTRGKDVIVGLGGDDVLLGRGGKDRICARAGNDRIRGGGGNDTLRGGADRDKIAGGGGRDACRGGGGRDKLRSCP